MTSDQSIAQGTGGSDSFTAWARGKTATLIGGNSPPIESQQRRIAIQVTGSKVLQEQDALLKLLRQQGVLLSEDAAPNSLKAKIQAHNDALQKMGQGRNTGQTRNSSMGHDDGPPGPPVAPGTASDDNGGMEKRISDLEQFAFETNARLSRVETKIDHIDKEVSNFKWWVIAQIVAGLLAVLGTGIAIQQMTVASFQGAAQVAKDAAAAAPSAPQPIIINVPTTAPAPAK